ncbi:MAG: hypothetical protein ACREYF_00520 [Gammaproteobacteria bacterium]
MFWAFLFGDRLLGRTGRRAVPADFYMRFPAQDFGLMDFNKLKKIAETGYSHACEKLSKWEKDGSLGRIKT